MKHLRSQGFALEKKNYVTPFGEADLIMKKGGQTFFIEVKTRSGRLFGDPKDAVDKRKREKYGKIAEYYSFSHPDEDVRFCVAEVLNDEINVLYDAF